MPHRGCARRGRSQRVHWSGVTTESVCAASILAPMGDPHWGDGTRAVWLALCQHARLPDNWECYPSIKRLSQDSGLVRATCNAATPDDQGPLLGADIPCRFNRVCPPSDRRCAACAPDPCHQRGPPYATNAALHVPPARSPHATDAAPPIPPARPEVEPLKLNFEVEPSKSSLVSATAPERRGGREICPEGCIDENSPNVKQARQYARRIRERLERKRQDRENPDTDRKRSDGE